MPVPFQDVDLLAGDSFSKFAGGMCARTYGCSDFVEVVNLSRGHFRGPRGIRLNTKAHPELEDAIFTLAADGIGTKVFLILVSNSHRSAARNLVAMTGGDVTRWGGKRLVFVEVLDASILGDADSRVRRELQELLLGLEDVAKEEGFVVLTGETAELGPFVGSDDPTMELRFNWAGVMLGVYHPDRMILGDTIRPGQIVVALKETSLRSNGYTTVRQVFTRRFGPRWWCRPNEEEAKAAQLAAMPSVLYDRLLEEANGWTGRERIPIHGIAHISGGGIPAKFGEGLLKPLGLSAELDNLWEPPLIAEHCLAWGGLTERYAYERWSSGNGAIAVLDENDVGSFLGLAAEHGKDAQPCGRIMASEGVPMLTIHSKYGGKEKLPFPLV